MSGIFTISDRWIKEYKSNLEAETGMLTLALEVLI